VAKIRKKNNIKITLFFLCISIVIIESQMPYLVVSRYIYLNSLLSSGKKLNLLYFHYNIMSNSKIYGNSFCFIFFFLRFILYKYSEAVFRHTRRGHQIPLQMVVSHHVVAGN
jgi:ABC-type multidrug transport system permease subunit